MIIALDSYYKDNVCNTSLVLFLNQDSSEPIYTDTIYTDVTSEYIPGEFYKRELPGIIQILEKLQKEHPEYWNGVNIIITDSFIKLKDSEHEWDGLGMHLEKYLIEKGQVKTIFGVAKTRFAECNLISEMVCRGESNTPLYVQSTTNPKIAAEFVKNMHGNYRIPTMLKLVDSLSRVFN